MDMQGDEAKSVKVLMRQIKVGPALFELEGQNITPESFNRDNAGPSYKNIEKVQAFRRLKMMKLKYRMQKRIYSLNVREQCGN